MTIFLRISNFLFRLKLYQKINARNRTFSIPPTLKKLTWQNMKLNIPQAKRPTIQTMFSSESELPRMVKMDLFASAFTSTGRYLSSVTLPVYLLHPILLFENKVSIIIIGPHFNTTKIFILDRPDIFDS